MKFKIGHRCDDCGRKISYGFVHKIEIRNIDFHLCDDCYGALFQTFMKTRRSMEENLIDEYGDAAV